MIDVSIIIVNYNTQKLVIDAVNSIFEKTCDTSYEIIVVDNNSSDNSVYTLKKYFDNKITIISLSENIGFGKANNKGVEIARGRNILLLNPDTLLISNAIKILSDYLDENPKCGAVGGNLLDENYNPTSSFGHLYLSVWYELNKLFFNFPLSIIYGKNTSYNYKNKPFRVKHIIGADMMVKSSLYRQCRGFDPDFFMYCEETELCWRIHKMGYELYSIPDAVIVHLEGKSFEYNENRELRRLEGREVYYKKCHSKCHYIVANYISLLSVGIRSLIFSIFRNKKKQSIYSYRYKLFKDYFKV